MCYSLWYNAPTKLPAGHRPATLWVHYTTSCNTQSSAPEDGQNHCPKHVEPTGIINKPLLLYLVGCVYYLYQWWMVKQISDNEIYLLIKHIKSVLWRVAKSLSYTEDTRCLKVNHCCALLNILILLTVICSWTLHTEHIVAFPLQQFLRGRAEMLRYTYVAYFLKNIKVNSYVCLIKLTYTHTHTLIFRNNGRRSNSHIKYRYISTILLCVVLK